MRNKLFKLAILGLASLTIAGWVQAEESGSKPQSMPVGSTEERLARLERMVNSRGLVDILLRLDSLQKDTQQIQGDGEVQLHKLEELKKRQRELYIDIDRRLLQLERKQTSGITSSSTKILAPVNPVKAAEMPVQNNKPAAAELKSGSDVNVVVSGGKPTGGGVRSAIPERVIKSPSESEQKTYQKAFNLLRELRYDKASEAFRKFIKMYPEGRYAHIAQYWLAEASYAQRKFEIAIVDYQKLINTYSGSPKRAEAMLKIGYSYYELKQYPKAQAILEQLLANYPGTTESGQAQNLIRKIKINNAS